jgi:hypothetical protein
VSQAPAPQPAAARPLPPEAFAQWYGPWEPLTPASVADFMDGFDRPWWIIGGWAIEAFTGVPRQHDDLDISILSSDAEAFRRFLGDRFTPWNMDQSWLRPFDDRFREVSPNSSLWIRKNARAPWVLDVPFTKDTDGLWTNKRWPDQVAPLDEVTWTAADGLLYLRPEHVLMMKSRLARDKDRIDAEVALPLLDVAQRHWLRDTIKHLDPEHPWLEQL